jgi:hypothetical protein
VGAGRDNGDSTTGEGGETPGQHLEADGSRERVQRRQLEARHRDQLGRQGCAFVTTCISHRTGERAHVGSTQDAREWTDVLADDSSRPGSKERPYFGK